MKKRITIHDVAREAEVSIATVSRALGDGAYVRPAMRARVREAALRLGYRRNLVAKNLKEGRTGIIIALLPEANDNPYYSIVGEAARRRGRELGYETLVGHFGWAADEFLATVHRFEERRPDGMLLCAPLAYSHAYRDRAWDGTCPFLSMDDVTGNSAGGAEALDWRASVLATEHLLSLGHRRVTYLCGPGVPSEGSREGGYAEAMCAAGLEACFVPGAEDLAGGWACAAAALGAAARPTALLARNDISAVGALRRLAEQGLRVPGEVSVAGFDNVTLSQFCVPSLTTVDMRPGDIARAALERLVAMIQGSPAPDPDPAAAEPLLVTRESTGPAPRP